MGLAVGGRVLCATGSAGARSHTTDGRALERIERSGWSSPMCRPLRPTREKTDHQCCTEAEKNDAARVPGAKNAYAAMEAAPSDELEERAPVRALPPMAHVNTAQ